MSKYEGNKQRFRGLQGQWRLPAFHKFLWDRTFTHALHGAASVSFMFLGWTSWTNQFWPITLIGVVWLSLFCLYEVQEAKEINDHAYIDLYGLLAGVIPSAIAWLVVALVLL